MAKPAVVRPMSLVTAVLAPGLGFLACVLVLLPFDEDNYFAFSFICIPAFLLVSTSGLILSARLAAWNVGRFARNLLITLLLWASVLAAIGVATGEVELHAAPSSLVSVGLLLLPSSAASLLVTLLRGQRERRARIKPGPDL